MSTRRAIHIAGIIIQLCGAHYPLFPKASEATIRAWAEVIDRYPYLTEDDWRRAVIVFYERPGSTIPVPGDILTIAKAIHQDDFQRQSREDIEAHWDQLDVRLAPRIEQAAEDMSVDKALTGLTYRRSEPNPLTVGCPYCSAIPTRRCTTSGRTMRTHHPARIDAAAADKALPPGQESSQ